MAKVIVQKTEAELVEDRIKDLVSQTAKNVSNKFAKSFNDGYTWDCPYQAPAVLDDTLDFDNALLRDIITKYEPHLIHIATTFREAISDIKTQLVYFLIHPYVDKLVRSKL